MDTSREQSPRGRRQFAEFTEAHMEKLKFALEELEGIEAKLTESTNDGKII